MTALIRVVIVEDMPDDAELMTLRLSEEGYLLDWQRVDNEPDYLAALTPPPDLILADWSLPQFSGLRALQLLRERSLDIPFIIVSGSVVEEIAVDAMRQGAYDYVLKDRLGPLGQAARRALEDKRLRDERKRAEEALRISEDRYRDLVEHNQDVVFICTHDLEGKFLSVNRGVAIRLGYGQDDLLKMNLRDILAPQVKDRLDEYLSTIQRDGVAKGLMVVQTITGEMRIWQYNNTLRTEGLETPIVRAMAYDITERRKAEEALGESERRYRTLAESAQDAIFILDREGRFQYLNRFGRDQLALSSEGILGKTLRQVFPAEVAEEQVLALQAVFESHKTFSHEIRITFPHGDEWLDVRLIPIVSQNGEVQSVMGIARDVTERKRAEEALRESEGKFKDLYDNAPVGYHEYDSDGRITNVNQTDLDMLGYTRDEMIGRHVWEFNIEEKIGREQLLEKMAGTRSPARALERTYRRRDGTTLPVLIEDRLILGESGRIKGMRCTIQDITDRKRAEASLRQSEENARRLAQENAIMAEIGRIISSTLDIDEVYEVFSEKVKKIIPFDRIVINIIDTEKGVVRNVYMAGKDLQDRNVKDIYPLEGSGNAEMVRTKSTLLIQSEDFSEHKDRFPTLLSTFQAGFRSIMNAPLFSKGKILGGLLLRSHNPHAYTEKDVRLAEGVASQIAGAIANAQLYAERTQAEKEKTALLEQLRQSQKMEAIGQLAGGVAHDFNNLLTVIRGYSQLSLGELPESDPLRENIEEIKESADRAAELTHQLLAFGRRQVMEMRVLDLNVVLLDAEKMLRRILGEDIELLTHLAGDLGRVKADPGQIEQVIMNLSVNARDAMVKGGILTIETANVDLDEQYARAHIAVKPGRYVMLSASDTGAGMTPEVRERIFEPFFTTKEKGKGTGLGLSTVYGIVKQSGGNMWVYSELGVGTTFKIYLPAVEEPLGELKPKIVKEELLCGNETILVAEDEKEVRQLAVRVLEKKGYLVLQANSGKEAIGVCSEHEGSIHLLVTDVVMPQMNGRDLAKRIASLRPGIKVLYMSGYTDNTIVHHGALDEGMDYLQKPFTIEGLARKVREVLDQ